MTCSLVFPLFIGLAGLYFHVHSFGVDGRVRNEGAGLGCAMGSREVLLNIVVGNHLEEGVIKGLIHSNS